MLESSQISHTNSAIPVAQRLLYSGESSLQQNTDKLTAKDMGITPELASIVVKNYLLPMFQQKRAHPLRQSN